MPTAPPLCEDAAHFTQVAGQPRQLLVHIDFSGKQRDLLADTLVADAKRPCILCRRILHRLAQPRGELLLVGGDGGGNVRRHGAAQFLDPGHALQQEFLELLAFAGTRRGKFLQCLLQQTEQRGAQFVGRGAGRFQHAAPAQHIRHAHGASLRQRLPYRVAPRGKLQQQLTIQRRAALRAARRIIDAALHLAALQLRGDRLTQRALEAAQLVRHAQLDVQVAVVDGAQLQHQRTTVEFRAGGGIASHAKYHVKIPE